MADGVENGMVYVLRLGGGSGRAQGGARVMQELILDAGHRVRDRGALGFGEFGKAGEERFQFALTDRIGPIAELAQRPPARR